MFEKPLFFADEEKQNNLNISNYEKTFLHRFLTAECMSHSLP